MRQDDHVERKENLADTSRVHLVLLMLLNC
jgi:hypothetical protein